MDDKADQRDISGCVRLTVNRDMPWWYTVKRTSGVWYLWDPEILKGDWIAANAVCWRVATEEEAIEIEETANGQ